MSRDFVYVLCVVRREIRVFRPDTVIDNETGKVVAIIGGRSQDAIQQTYSLNRGFQSYMQPGSSFKPLAVYTPALEEGYTANSTLTEIDVSSAKKFVNESGSIW